MEDRWHPRRWAKQLVGMPLLVIKFKKRSPVIHTSFMT
jgi:hypothetical protein